MPYVHDYVSYGSQGICQVEDLRPLKFGSDRSPRNYYVLRPLHQNSAQIFVPADKEALLARMRPVLTPEEIRSIVRSVKDQTMPWIADRRQRAAQFQDILSRRDTRELLLLISCLYLHRKSSPRGLGSGDAQVLKAAEAAIEQEFSFALRRSPQTVGAYIRQELDLPEP